MNAHREYLRDQINIVGPELKELKASRKEPRSRSLWEIDRDILKRKARATAILNTMHHLRGTGLVHQVPEQYSYYYTKELLSLEVELDAAETNRSEG